MDEERNESQADNFYPLDEPAIALFADGQRQIESINARMVGVMQLYLRQHKLDGQGRVAENGRELCRVENQAPVGS